MSYMYFKAKMHEIRFQLGLRPRPLWESLQRSPDHLAWIKGGATSKGREGKKDGREREWKVGERKRGGKRGENHTVTFCPPLRALLLS